MGTINNGAFIMYKVIYLYTGRVLYQGDDWKAAREAMRKNGTESSLVLFNGQVCDKRTGKPRQA